MLKVYINMKKQGRLFSSEGNKPIKNGVMRIRSKNLYLTYSQTEKNWTREFMLEELTRRIEIKNYVIGLEYHLDGGLHFHIVICLKQQPSKAMDFFNIKDPITGKPYHPNIQKADIVHDVLYSIKEDKEYLIKGFDVEALRKKAKEVKESNILNQCIRVFQTEGYNKALDFFLETATISQKGKFTTRVKNVLKSLNEMKNRLPITTAKYQIDDFYKLVGVEEFIKVFKKDSGHGAMFIGGVSNAGKTHYIEALLTSFNYKWITIGDLEELKSYDLNSLDFIIFDDVCFKRIKQPEEFLKLFEHLKPTSIPCRNYNPIIPAGVGRIFLSNLSFYQLLDRRKIETNVAVLRRVFDCVIIHYLSPKIPKHPKSKAIVYYPQHTINLNFNNCDIKVEGDLNINLRDYILPEYNSLEDKIINIDSFAEKKLTE